MTVTIEVPASVPAQLRKPEGDAGGADTLIETDDEEDETARRLLDGMVRWACACGYVEDRPISDDA